MQNKDVSKVGADSQSWKDCLITPLIKSQQDNSEDKDNRALRWKPTQG